MKKLNQFGITLIALVVTIVVLLILAGVTINMLFSENGIITKAKQAAEATQQAQKNDLAMMQNLADEMGYIINSTTMGIKLDQTSVKLTVGSSVTLTATVTPEDLENKAVNWTSSDENVVTVENGVVTGVAEGEATITVTTVEPSDKKAECKVTVERELSSLAKLVGKAASDTNQTVEDEYGNKIVVPAGFIVKAHSGTDLSDVTYGYSGYTNSPTVQDGIVIENEEDGNQFVWVPVGDIKNKDNTTTTITLGRYSDFTISEDGTLPIPEQVASKTEYDVPVGIVGANTGRHIEFSNDFGGGTFNDIEYKAANEYTDANGNTNTKSYDLQEWISTTLDNGGYYIARYEASKNEEKAASKISTGSPVETGGTVQDGMLWNNITQPDAAIAAKAMYEYSENVKYYSDLINSYAWDTAIIFIEVYSGNITYAYKKGIDINDSLTNTGINDDKVCNIHDMSGNAFEWTTEIFVYGSAGESTRRGGIGYSGFNPDTSARSNYSSVVGWYNISFRTVLCVK